MSATRQAGAPRRARAAMTGVALGGLVAGLTPVHAAHRAWSLARSARRTGLTETIPRVSLATLDLETIMGARRPVVITDLIETIPFRRRPDVDGLRELAAAVTTPFTVRSHRDHAPYFLYVGDYGAEVERSEQMDLGAFLDMMFVDGPPPGTCVYRLFSTRDLDGAIGEMVDDIASAIAPLTSRPTERAASGVWVGSEGVVTPLHHDAWPGLLLQMEGRKRVAMYPPGDRVNLSFVSPFSATERWSTLPARSAEADPDEHPRLSRATRWQGHLAAGEALYIPPFWSHEVEALSANISIPFRFRTRPADHLNPGFLRPAYETFHRKYLASRATG